MDAWTFHWGVVDVHGHPKPAYIVARSCNRPVYLSALRGEVVIGADSAIDVTASNYGPALEGASPDVKISDRDGRAEIERGFSDLAIPGDFAPSTVARLELEGLKPGLHSIELRLRAAAGDEAAATVELFFIE